MTDATALPDPALRSVQECPEARRVSEEQPFQLAFIRHRHEHGGRAAILRHDNGAIGTPLQVFAQPGLHIGYRCDLHSSNSSLPMKRRLPLFTAMARISTRCIAWSDR